MREQGNKKFRMDSVLVAARGLATRLQALAGSIRVNAPEQLLKGAQERPSGHEREGRSTRAREWNPPKRIFLYTQPPGRSSRELQLRKQLDLQMQPKHAAQGIYLYPAPSSR